MTPERAEYARKRINRLNQKIEMLGEQIRGYGSRSISTDEHAIVTKLVKQRRSSVTSRKRWERELARG